MTNDEAQAIFESEDERCQTCMYGHRSEQRLPAGDGYYWHNDGIECMCRDMWLCPAVIERGNG
jgi:hypothetical protein